MKNNRKLLILIPILLFVLACQAVMRPIEDVQDVSATAVSAATQITGLTTEIAPFETFIPSAIPELPSGNPLDPKSPPLKEWKGIPIFPQATAGDETEGMYVFSTGASSQEIQDYYKKQLADLGWESSFSMPMEGTAILLYTKGNQVLSITIMPPEGSGETIVFITLQ